MKYQLSLPLKNLKPQIGNFKQKFRNFALRTERRFSLKIKKSNQRLLLPLGKNNNLEEIKEQENVR
jgi:hypothetical protein